MKYKWSTKALYRHSLSKNPHSSNRFLLSRNPPNITFPKQGYNVFFKNRQAYFRASGGIGIFVNNFFESTEIHIHFPLEVITISIHLKTPLCICNIYLPDSTNLLLNDLNDIIKLPKPFLFIVDFNRRNLIWGSNHIDA
jgi:hypothetical protein